jgi:integrase
MLSKEHSGDVMANEDHLAILHAGAEQWNAWRKEHQDISPDLTGADLTGAHLGGADLRVAHQIKADRREARLSEEPRVGYLRHTAATLLGRSINPKVVSEMLGHSHVSVTLGIYSHVMPHMQQQAAEAMDMALGQHRDSCS